METIDKFAGDKVQVKQISIGAGVALVYQAADKDVRKIFGAEMSDGKY